VKLRGKILHRFNSVHFVFWLVPGAVLNYFLQNFLWWTNWMSWFAIVLSVGTMWGASRTERKQDTANPAVDEDQA
jgi:hypothetical protein